MDQWKRNNPDRDWVTEEKERHTIKPGADNADMRALEAYVLAQRKGIELNYGKH